MIHTSAIEHRTVYDKLSPEARKCLAYLLQVDEHASGTDRRYTRSVKPSPLGQHLLGVDVTTHLSNREAAKVGLTHLRVLAAHRCVYCASEREGWRLTPYGKAVAACAQHVGAA